MAVSMGNGTTGGGWSSRTAFVLAAIGSAVGLGNIWRFPSEAGTNGGGAFVIFYIACVALIGLPLLLAEMVIGRHGQASAVKSTRKLAYESGVSPRWSILASLGTWASFFILCFYSVVAGWVLYYIGLFASDLFQNGIGPAFVGQDKAAVSGYLDDLFGNLGLLVLLHAIFMGLTVFTVMRGISGGIEKAAIWLMPTFFILLLGITLYALSTGAWQDALSFLFAFDPDRLFHAPVMLSALGQAFFSLSLGAAMIITYGSYASHSTPLGSAALTVAIADTMVAIISGLAIFPIVFAANLDVAAGPALMFQSLPVAFQSMPGGSLVGLLFFVMVLFAALTSSVSVLEVPVARAMDVFALGRPTVTLFIGTCAFLIGVGAAASISGDFNFSPFGAIPLFQDGAGKGMGLFDTLDTLTGKIMMPLSGFFTALFVGWRAKRALVAAEHRMSESIALVWHLLVAWLCPLAVGAILIFGLLSI